ncbi:MAG TPA: DUF2934 domain-containing protein [Candidatus Sulfotelmatobacter sp.]|nr:DUF2934 domain-containing protein [Candidatus Sulfotelmatobacter sp.]
MAEMVERKIRRRARQLYDTRGQAEGSELKDWFEAESEVLGSSILAPVYRKVRVESAASAQINRQANTGTPAQ